MPESVVPLIAVGVVIVLFIVLLSALTSNYSLNGIKSKTVGDGQHGTARWATDQEIRKAYVTVPFDVASWRAGKKRPTVQGLVLGSIKFDDFLEYAHKNWNFHDGPRSAPFMQMVDTLISKAPQEWSPDDVERILEMFEKFDAEGMMHTYALHGYYQVISDMKDLGYDSDTVQRVVKLLHEYNQTFHVNFDTSADKFQNYYKDLSQRVKAREVDLLIVVNMFLTGFDATTLNTLWVDKNLKMHGLIQAFSRTNRILNSVKTYGNIVCFRNLQKATDDAIALFGDREASGVVLLKGYDAYYDGYEENGKAVPG